MLHSVFSDICTDHFGTTDIESIAIRRLGLLFLSHCSKDMDEESDVYKIIEDLLDQDEQELLRQKALVYDQSVSTNPHVPMYETQEDPPSWVWEIIYGYKSRRD